MSKVFLRDISTQISRGISPKYHENTGLVVINQKCIRNARLDLSFSRFHNMEKRISENKYLVPGDVLINSTGVGTAGRVGIWNKTVHATVDSHVSIVRPDISRIDPNYLFNALRYREDEIESYAEGSTGQIELSRVKIGEIEINLPPLPEQKAIASVLSSLDDKIDLLHRQNKTLEAMAETLFRQWFIEEAKEDWEEVTLNDIVLSANTGLDAIRRAPIVENETGIKCLRIQDISQSKPFHAWGNTEVLDRDFDKAQLKAGDLIMARTCSPGIVYLCREDLHAVFNNGLAKIRPDLSKTYSLFLYYLFKSEEFIGHIYGISDGTSVQLNMKLGDLLSYKLRFPPKNRQDELYPIFQSIDNKQLYNSKQIQTLENLRDTLLPKLMSGEVRVQYQTEEVA